MTRNYLKYSFSIVLVAISFFSNSAEKNADALALRPIVEGPVNLNLPTQVFNTPNSMDEIFKILKTLDFKPVPGVSLFAEDNIIENTTPQGNVPAPSTPSKKPRNQQTNTNVPNSGSTQVSSSEIKALKQKIETLENALELLQTENTKLKQTVPTVPSSTRLGLSHIANNLVEKFSEENVKQNAEQLRRLENELASANEEITSFESKIKLLNELPKEGDQKLISQIKELNQTLDKERKISQERQGSLEEELSEKSNLLVKSQRELEQLQIIQARNESMTNDLSNELASAQTPLKAEIDALTQQNTVLKKAYQEEKLRSESLIETLTNTNKTLQNKLNEAERKQNNESQNQSRLLLELQNRAQQAELMRQKLQQQLLLAEQNSIQLQEQLEKLTAENLKNNQNFQLQLTDLQQRLVNARRSEQEANRWARAAGVGNTNAANTRILNLQQQIDALSASEEQQRSIALFNQQQVNTLQSELAVLQAKIKAEQQSKAQLEKQITNLENEKIETKETSKKENTQDENKSISLNQQLNQSIESLPESKNKKAILSTEAGVQKL
ncbi:hypothetical protein [Thorsellia kenyensis]|uniref:Uncharacterized protein n=1 Tax=Thorsellia kenyensis TaxID=1549888 RepID=A0ABV6C6R3_9GAMM